MLRRFCFVLLGLALVAAGGGLIYTSVPFLVEGERVQGEVIGTGNQEPLAGIGMQPKVRFRSPQRQFETPVDFTVRPYALNSKVSVIYIPDNPRLVTVDDVLRFYIVPGIAFLAGLLAFALAMRSPQASAASSRPSIALATPEIPAPPPAAPPAKPVPSTPGPAAPLMTSPPTMQPLMDAPPMGPLISAPTSIEPAPAPAPKAPTGTGRMQLSTMALQPSVTDARQYFQGRTVAGWNKNRNYRVFLRPQGLLFYKLPDRFLDWGVNQGGAQGIANVLTSEFGMIGEAVGGAIVEGAKLLGKGPDRQWERRLDSAPLEELLGDSPDNFMAQRQEIAGAMLEPVGFWHGWSYPREGLKTGLFKFRHQGRGKFTFEFFTLDDTNLAIGELPKILGQNLDVNLRWSNSSLEFVAK